MSIELDSLPGGRKRIFLSRGSTMKKILLTATLALASTALSPAYAAVTVFNGSDNGVSSAGPFTNSAASQASFLAAAGAYGSVSTNGFEATPLGYNASFSMPGVAITVAAPNYGPSFSGVAVADQGALYAFNTTSGGANWFGFPGGSATFNFAAPTNSFGFYLTGLQTTFGAGVTVTQLDGTSATYSIASNSGGGAWQRQSCPCPESSLPK